MIILCIGGGDVDGTYPRTRWEKQTNHRYKWSYTTITPINGRNKKWVGLVGVSDFTVGVSDFTPINVVIY